MFNKLRAPHLSRGDEAEQQALCHLRKQGLKLIDKNYRCQYGEIDLIMEEKQTLVIVEVRYRQSAKYGGALESVTPQKQSRIIKTAEHYIMNRSIAGPIRFDVVALSGDNAINWIKNAFQT